MKKLMIAVLVVVVAVLVGVLTSQNDQSIAPINPEVENTQVSSEEDFLLHEGDIVNLILENGKIVAVQYSTEGRFPVKDVQIEKSSQHKYQTTFVVSPRRDFHEKRVTAEVRNIQGELRLGNVVKVETICPMTPSTSACNPINVVN